MRSPGMIANVLRVICALMLITQVFGCEKSSDESTPHTSIDPEILERGRALMRKADDGAKLERSEISSLSATLAMTREYDKAISLLEKLARDNRYADEMDELYFHLSLFYYAKAETTTDERQRAESLRRSEHYLGRGFEATHEKAMAFYKRGKVFWGMGCFTKAIADMREATRLASTKDLVDYGEGIFLSKAEFIRIVEGDIGRLEKFPDRCKMQ